MQVDGTQGNCSTATDCYVYDGDGNRVEKGTSSASELYWYGASGNVLDQTDGSGSISNSNFNEYIFFNGTRIARLDSSANVSYYFADHLGSSRVITDASGNVCYDVDFYPFGGERTSYTNTCQWTNNYKFTGKERDPESGKDDFWARYYASNMARFMSPDDGSDQNPADPQSWNLYGYVRNRPLMNIDPTGHQDCGSDGATYTTGWMGEPPTYSSIWSTPGPSCDYTSSAWDLFFGRGNISFLSAIQVLYHGQYSSAPNKPAVLQNPCQFQGRALPPSAYAQTGQAANGNLTNYALDIAMGWPKSGYLNAQPLASGNVFQNQAYGNYVFGVYMAARGTSLSGALNGASTFSLLSGAYFTYTNNGDQMDPNYPLLPAANVGNITNGYNAYVNGTVCHN